MENKNKESFTAFDPEDTGGDLKSFDLPDPSSGRKTMLKALVGAAAVCVLAALVLTPLFLAPFTPEDDGDIVEIAGADGDPEDRYAFSTSLKEAASNDEILPAMDGALGEADDGKGTDIQTGTGRASEGGYPDGAQYHQKQPAKPNCGATSFIVGVNIVLGEVITTDNVKVWREMGGNTLTNLQGKGAAWLKSKGLDDRVVCYKKKGGVMTTQDLRDELSKGHCVIMCSNNKSRWKNADGSYQPEDAHKSGHWVVFYYYDKGKQRYYSNDSSRKKELGAGAWYTESQMKSWLDNRHCTTTVIVSPK